MDWTKFHQEEIARRQSRRQKQQPASQPQGMRNQLFAAIQSGALPKESPADYVARLWERRRKLAEIAKKKPVVAHDVRNLEEKIIQICTARGIQHPGLI